MHDNIYVEGLEEGQVLADEIWTKIDQEIALHSEDELKKGFIVRGFSDYLFLVIKKMNLEFDFIEKKKWLDKDYMQGTNQQGE